MTLFCKALLYFNFHKILIRTFILCFNFVYFFIFHRDLMEELVVYIREAVDRKQENMRRRRRRDALRLQLVRVLEKIAENGTFGVR